MKWRIKFDKVIREVGPLEFKSRKAEVETDLMKYATKRIVSCRKTTSIKRCAEIMVRNGFRRLPILDAKRIAGIVTSMDIVNFLGGGEKFEIIKKKYGGNILAAVNASVSLIMEKDVIFVEYDSSLKDAIEVMKKHNIGCLPIVRDEKIVGIITERDIIKIFEGRVDDERKVSDCMTRKVITITPGTTLIDCARIMVRNGFRRLPVVSEEKLVGIVTSMDILKALALWKLKDSSDVEEALKERVSEIMVTDLKVINENAKLSDALKIMGDCNIGCLPVVRQDKLVGIITERDILRVVADEG